MYCLKCKKKMQTTNQREEVTKNGRRILKGNCAICNTKKNVFISGGNMKKTKKGGSILNRMINLLPVEMHLFGHNFTGPGTKLNKRLNPDLTPKEWSKPINRIDKSAYHHDICYLKNTDTKTRNEVCDANMLNEMKAIQNPTIRERAERAVVSSLIGTKKYFGMGLKKKSQIHR